MTQNCFIGQRGTESREGLVLLNDKEADKDKKVVAVIVTIVAGQSYDHLFT